MRIHHLNCISSCPIGGSLFDGRSKSLHARLTCHCLLVETGRELVLVDTGYGLEDVRHPKTRLSRFFLALLRPELREEMTAVRQVVRLGFDPLDVKHIVLTHLDFDHAGGLDDFPHARVHLLGIERDHAFRQKTLLDRMRYRPQQWSTSDNWKVYASKGGGDAWFGFDCVRALDGVHQDIALVPLPGHTFGHCGVVVRRDHDWLLLAGDAYFYHGEMDVERPRCTIGLRFYQWLMQKDGRLRHENQRRLRELVKSHPHEVKVVSSHDLTEFERLSGRRADAPIITVPAPIFEPISAT